MNFFQKMSGFVCCPVSRIEVVHFSEKETNFKVSSLFSSSLCYYEIFVCRRPFSSRTSWRNC